MVGKDLNPEEMKAFCFLRIHKRDHRGHGGATRTTEMGRISSAAEKASSAVSQGKRFAGARPV
jgi:hypothetical protein